MSATRLAIDGGAPVRKRPFPPWPSELPGQREALTQVLASGEWHRGSGEPGRGAELEARLAEHSNALGAATVTNGTHAMEVAYRALALEPGDEVLVPASTFIASAAAASFAGLTPVPVDVRPETLVIDVEDARRKSTERTRAVVAVHLGGMIGDMEELLAYAASTGMYVVEDAAPAYGSSRRGRPSGSFGDISAFSFQAGKVVTAGEGGAVVVRDDPALLNRVLTLVNCGVSPGRPWHEHSMVGSNYRMTEFQAVLVLSQLGLVEEGVERRAEAAACLVAELQARGFRTLAGDPQVRSNWANFFIPVPPDLAAALSPRLLSEALIAEGVPLKPFFEPWHTTPAYGMAAGACPVAEEAGNTMLLAHHSLLLDGEQGAKDIATALEKVYISGLWGRPAVLDSRGPEQGKRAHV